MITSIKFPFQKFEIFLTIEIEGTNKIRKRSKFNKHGKFVLLKNQTLHNPYEKLF
jgi:hypothetical protein